MLIDPSKIGQVYIVCGKTDLRRGIDGLAGVVQEQFNLDPYSQALYLFCGTRKDRFKALYWDGDGFFCCISVWRMVGFNGQRIRMPCGS
ncbi:IS66 family insertion sequence element accessory protein TnpB [Levilactobacillus sp. HBUAS70063]|uniref:IS66 family insertion sequence element accessory protein TnpB n=1 Tax=Levilactobacillus sp. HBUAS70063 TaxID=3109359 RepID=UPI0040535105